MGARNEAVHSPCLQLNYEILNRDAICEVWSCVKCTLNLSYGLEVGGVMTKLEATCSLKYSVPFSVYSALVMK